MLGHKVFGSGIAGLSVQAICQDIAAGLTATGTTQGDAYPVTTGKAAFSTVASGAGAVLTASASGGDSQVLYNGGANPLKVYPPSGARINNAPVNGAVTLATHTGCEFHCMTTSQWFGVLSA